MIREAFVIELPLRGEYTASGHTLSVRRGIVVRVTERDTSGWGEFVELPGYSLETTETALAAMTGSPVTHANPAAVAALRTAELDQAAKREDISLAEKLGASPGGVPAGAVVARLGDLEGTIREAADRFADGYRKIKVKIGPGFDLDPLASIRTEHPEMPLAADANGSYPPGGIPPEIDELELLYLEQPYPPQADWREFTSLRSSMSTPISLDESVTGPPTLRTAIAAGACDVVTMKSARFGGLMQAVEMHDLAVASGIGLVAGGLLETGIGRAAAAAYARLPGFVFPSDLSASNRYWDQDLTDPWVLENGNLVVPDSPGIGVKVDESFLAEVTRSRHLLPG